MPPLNVLLLLVDDLRPELAGGYSASEAITPNMDKLASAAVVFERAFCQQAICAPTRNSFLSGRRPQRTQSWNFLSTPPKARTHRFGTVLCRSRLRIAVRLLPCQITSVRWARHGSRCLSTSSCTTTRPSPPGRRITPGCRPTGISRSLGRRSGHMCSPKTLTLCAAAPTPQAIRWFARPRRLTAPSQITSTPRQR